MKDCRNCLSGRQVEVEIAMKDAPIRSRLVGITNTQPSKPKTCFIDQIEVNHSLYFYPRRFKSDRHITGAVAFAFFMCLCEYNVCNKQKKDKTYHLFLVYIFYLFV